MKNHLLLSLLLFIAISGHAQSFSWLWAESYEESLGGYCNNLCTDANNNVYVTGGFYDSVLIIGNDTLINPYTNGSGVNMFIAKYGPSGNALWARAAVGPNKNAGQGISVDANGNVYLAGNFSTSFIVIGTDTIPNAGGESLYIAKYDSSGNLEWVEGTDGPTDGFSAEATSIITDGAGNIYLSGYFESDYIVFGADTLTGILANEGNAFIVKYNPAGNVSWAEKLGDSTELATADAISADNSGNIYVTGGFFSSTFTLNGLVLTNAGNENIFAAKLDSSGNVIWAKSAGGNENDFGNGIVTDAAGNVYVAGDFSSHELAFGHDTVINAASIGNYNVFLVKYNASGDRSWVNSSEGNFYQSNTGISADANGHIYLAGNFTSTNLDFVGYDLKNKDTTGSTTDMYLVQYDTSGNVGWAISAGGIGSDEVYGLSADTKGNLCIAGEFASPAMVLGLDTLTDMASDNNVADIFVAKYGILDTTGIRQIAQNTQHLMVYPNPSTGQFYFQGITCGSTLEIYDVVGQNIFSSIVTGDTYLLNISSVAKGVYFYRVIDSATNVQEGKIVVD